MKLTDKVQKIREGVERLKSNLIRGACASQIAMETRCKEEAYNEVLAILDTLQEEPVSEEWIEELRTKLYSLSKEDFEKVWAKYSRYGDEEPVSEFLNTESMIESYKQRLISQANGVKNSPLINMCLASYKHGINEILDTLNLSNVQRTIKSCKEKPVSEALEEASKEWLRPQLDKSYAAYGETKQMELTRFDGYAMLDAIEFGTNWQKNHLWKPADGDDLPEYDREVITLLDNGRVAFAHRPNPEGWDAKSIITEKVERYIPETYGKGGWNIQDVKWWLDCNMPKVEED